MEGPVIFTTSSGYESGEPRRLAYNPHAFFFVAASFISQAAFALTGSSQGLMNDAWLSLKKNNVLNTPSYSVCSLGKHKK